MVQLLIGAIVAWGISSYFETDLLITAAAVAVVWIWYTHRTAPAPAAGGAGGGGILNWITTTVTRIFGSVEKFVVSAGIFLALMLLVGWLTRVSPYWVIQRFIVMGAPWNWGADTGLPVLLFVCEVVLAGGIAFMAPRGQWRVVVVVFGSAALLVFVMMGLPRTTEEIRPKPKGAVTNPAIPGKPTRREEADQAVTEKVAESKERGIVPVVVDTTTRLGFGKPDPEYGVIGGGAKRFWTWAFGPPAPKKDTPPTGGPAAYSAPEPASVKVPAPVLHPFEANGCYEVDLGAEARWSPNKGSMRVFDPTGASHVETLGQKSPVSAFGPGHWRFCAEGEDAATGALIWE